METQEKMILMACDWACNHASFEDLSKIKSIQVPFNQGNEAEKKKIAEETTKFLVDKMQGCKIKGFEEITDHHRYIPFKRSCEMFLKIRNIRFSENGGKYVDLVVTVDEMKQEIDELKEKLKEVDDAEHVDWIATVDQMKQEIDNLKAELKERESRHVEAGKLSIVQGEANKYEQLWRDAENQARSWKNECEKFHNESMDKGLKIKELASLLLDEKKTNGTLSQELEKMRNTLSQERDALAQELVNMRNTLSQERDALAQELVNMRKISKDAQAKLEEAHERNKDLVMKMQANKELLRCLLCLLCVFIVFIVCVCVCVFNCIVHIHFLTLSFGCSEFSVLITFSAERFNAAIQKMGLALTDVTDDTNGENYEVAQADVVQDTNQSLVVTDANVGDVGGSPKRTRKRKHAAGGTVGFANVDNRSGVFANAEIGSGGIENGGNSAEHVDGVAEKRQCASQGDDAGGWGQHGHAHGGHIYGEEGLMGDPDDIFANGPGAITLPNSPLKNLFDGNQN
jgi:hypothetical protein